MSIPYVHDFAELQEIERETVSPFVSESPRRVVYRETNGDAGYQVSEIEATLQNGDHVYFHASSVSDGQPGVVCVAFQQKDCKKDPAAYLLIAQHWRPALDEYFWEFPRGMGLKNESIADTAIREFKEETGLQVSEECVHELQRIHADAGVLMDDVRIVELNVSSDTLRRDAKDWELNNLQWVSVSVFIEMIEKGLVEDALTLSAFALTMIHHGEWCRN